MSYSTVNIPTSFTTDAEFRAWAQAIDSAITGLGLVATGDTGQADLTTLTLPAGTSVSAPGGAIYYKIYRFDDSLQSSAPVFIRVEFWSSSNLATRPRVKFFASHATNGAGGLTGYIGPFDMDPGGGSATSQTSYVSGGTNRLTLAIWGGTAADGGGNYRAQFITIERSKAADGTDNSESIVAFAHNSNFTQAAGAHKSAGNETNSPGTLSYNASSTLQDSKKVVYSVWPPASYTHGPLHGVVFIESGDLPATQGTAFDTAIDSSGVKNWKPLPPSGVIVGTPAGGTGQSRVCMRYGPDGNAQSTGHTPIPPIASSSGGSGGGSSPTVPTSGRVWPRQR